MQISWAILSNQVSSGGVPRRVDPLGHPVFITGPVVRSLRTGWTVPSRVATTLRAVPSPLQRDAWRSRITILALLLLVLVLAGCTLPAGDDPGDDDDTQTDFTEPTDDEAGDDDDKTDPDETNTEDSSPNEDEQHDRPPPDGELEIHHIDVNQADATLVITPTTETILIDSGDWTADGDEVIAHLESLGIERIDHLVATHGHADHIGGHPAVIEWAETHGDGIGTAYDSGVPHTTATFENYLDAVEEHEVDLFTVEDGDQLPLADDAVSATVVNPPTGESGDDLDYNSVSLVIEFGDVRYLTSGDAGADAEERMVDAWGDRLDVDVYQVGHHGSTTSSTTPFLDAVDPDTAVISSAADSQYGHPHDEVLAALESRDVSTYWTGMHGTIVLTTDGEEVTFKTDESFSTDSGELLDAKHQINDATAAASGTEPDDGQAAAADEQPENDTDEEEESTANGDASSLEITERNVDGVAPDEESITLSNTGDAFIELGGWQIRDRGDDGQVARGFTPFRFPSDFELAPGEVVRIWTGEGETTDEDLYWAYGVNIWRAEGDVIILIDADREYVLEHPYGDQ